PDRPRDSLNCLAVNPSQVSQIATGSSEGLVTTWDIRNCSGPLKQVHPHETHVYELIFHPYRPAFLFSCSEDGTIGVINLNASSIEGFRDYGMARENAMIHKYNYDYNDLAINSIDYHPLSKLLIGGGDGQNLFSMKFD
ncbi:14145_t:CDS:2, partial [Acaulospora morrowiae]